jgi:hypothetical protein
MTDIDPRSGLVPFRWPDDSREQTDYETPIGAMLRERTRLLQREVLKGTAEAVYKWAGQCGMTPEKWLEFYMPELEMLPSEEMGQVRFRISAKPIDPFSFAVEVSALQTPKRPDRPR